MLTLNDQLINDLPDCIGNLKQLQTLFVRNNQLTSLPASLNECTNLRVLDLKANSIAKLPDLNGLQQLQELNLSFNNGLTLDSEAAQFGKLNNLQKLDISYLPASNHTIATLQQAMPKAEIIYLTYDDLKFKPDRK